METNTEPLHMVTYNQDVEILPADMSPVDRVGRMARLCYKVEPKEGEDTDAINRRIITRCIKEGHESVLEHAAFSLFFPVREVPDSKEIAAKITGAKNHSINFRAVWESNPTDAQKRYLFAFNDPEAMSYHCNEVGLQDVPEEDRGVAPVVLGNARALRLALREKMFATVTMYDDPIAFVIVVKAIHALYEQCPVMFQDLVDEVTKFLTDNRGDEKSRYRMDRMLLAKLTDDERSDINKFVARFFNVTDVIFATPAALGTTFSMIITTDRATTHQHVRHRKDVAYSQESQRYVNYDKKGYGHMAFTIDPAKAKNIKVDPATGVVASSEEAHNVYEEAMRNAFRSYRKLLELGVPSESARKVLPNDCVTRIGVTWLLPGGFGNFLFWRTDRHAQFDIRRLAVTALIKGLEMDHPYFYLFNPEVIKKFLAGIKEQHLVDDELFEKLDATQEARIRLANTFREAQAKEIERLKKEAEEEARKKAEENAADPNALPPNAPKIIRVGEPGNSTVDPEEVHTENVPRIDRLPNEDVSNTTETSK